MAGGREPRGTWILVSGTRATIALVPSGEFSSVRGRAGAFGTATLARRTPPFGDIGSGRVDIAATGKPAVRGAGSNVFPRRAGIDFGRDEARGERST